MLFFFAGYEIDFERIRGRPLALGAWGWLLSLALAYGIGGALAAAGVVVSFLYTGSALATTAIGTLIPILRDGGRAATPGSAATCSAAGARRRVRPDPAGHARALDQPAAARGRVLVAFIVLALAPRARLGSARLARASRRWSEPSSRAASSPFGSRPCSSSGWSGSPPSSASTSCSAGFVAGMIVRAALRGRELAAFESKLTAVGFGFLIPFFFVDSGINFDLEALGSRRGDRASWRSSSSSSWSSAASPRCCSTAACSRPAIASRSRSSPPPSCRSSSRSPRWRPTPARCALRPRPGWSARRCSRR